ncbi:IS1/IS1595 family N-terminal zinc-binding domain-containing protein [Chryseobacterium proteolyticum]
MENKCPKCNSTHLVKSGVINQKQRFHCKSCNYYFTVKKNRQADR